MSERELSPYTKNQIALRRRALASEMKPEPAQEGQTAEQLFPTWTDVDMTVPLTPDQWYDLVNRMHDLVEQYGIDEVKVCAQYLEEQCALKKP